MIQLNEVASTQDAAREAFQGEPLLVTATKQTSGRGRNASEWLQAPRAVTMSLAYVPTWELAQWPLVSLAVGVAVTNVLVATTLKWPNDVLLEGDKVGGLLVEGQGSFIVVGVGINVWWPDSPSGYRAVAERDPGPAWPIDLSREVTDELLRLDSFGPFGWMQTYRERCVTIGQTISWQPNGEGRAVGVTDAGELTVETVSGLIHLRSGAVQHVRSSGRPASD